MIRPACIPIIPSYTRKQSSKQSSEQKYCYAHTSTPAAPAQGADHGSALVYSPAGGRWLRRSYIPPRVGPRRVASADPRGYSSSCIFLKICLPGRSAAASLDGPRRRDGCAAAQRRCAASRERDTKQMHGHGLRARTRVTRCRPCALRPAHDSEDSCKSCM